MINTTLCYIEKEDKYLMLHRIKKQNDLNKDKWIGVGGKFEDKESPEDCVLREALEETGLTLNKPEFRGIVTFVSDEYETEYMHLFTSKSFSGSLKECSEGVLEWVNKKDVYSLSLWEGDKLFYVFWTALLPFSALSSSIKGKSWVFAALNGEKIL